MSNYQKAALEYTEMNVNKSAEMIKKSLSIINVLIQSDEISLVSRN
jgi:hypothetical protein